MERIRTLIADDYPPFRRLLRDFLAAEPQVELVGEADSGPDVIAKAQKLEPDVILLDIGLPGLSGVEALRLIKTQQPGIRVIALLEEDNRHYRDAVVECGANFCLAKELVEKELPSIFMALKGHCGKDAPSLADEENPDAQL